MPGAVVQVTGWVTKPVQVGDIVFIAMIDYSPTFKKKHDPYSIVQLVKSAKQALENGMLR
jgi:aspartyl-tRNA synthetase